MITVEELEKLAELKEKGIITEDEFNAKKDEFFKKPSNKKNVIEHIYKSVIGHVNNTPNNDTTNDSDPNNDATNDSDPNNDATNDSVPNNDALYSKLKIFLGIFILFHIGLVCYVKIKSSQTYSSESNVESGFTISISCQFNGMKMPLAVCTNSSNAVIITGADRRSYNGNSMPSTYNVPEHYDFTIYNGSDKYTIDMRVTNNATGSTVSRRQVGPYSGDRIRN
jgi:hypothetical protein